MEPDITSFSNPKIKNLVKLQTKKRERDKREDNEDYVVRSNFDKRMSRYSINRHLKKLGEKANTKTKVTPVILRHTFATHILEAGVPLDILKKLNGARKHR